ncbi:alpha-D-ribose 1-methylphosphonate 5-triphosphate diphosphatase [Halonotius terrestris]|uniref:Alpha-D-ribose 1-methylphosphonate 5-triphosphate diphosphatase n=1 Tax=Halonotius terrestris TaxID=2487750 RepID=A0A8J8PAI6_9EURY|nr:alpha-D-ribose 1-methylphosphonate 5-triphosphate diphosphatase [Halonotius terrestris]TQQ79311.1 alpha-D-ribose 1-methylphosphonate 5-triphosphate diphosphatase [Halonotius terrestris]
MSGITEIRHARVVTPTTVIEDGHVVITGNRIAAVGPTPGRELPRTTTIDAEGRTLMPGLIDLHGDDIEGHREPRAGAEIPLPTALTAADRANLCNGVTTKFHAVAFEDAPDDGRSIEAATALATELDDEEYTLGDNRLHARCELTAGSVDAVEDLSETAAIDLLSVMHHAPGTGQYDAESFERHYIEDRNWPADSVAAAARSRASMAEADREARITRLADLADRLDCPLASHDDESPAEVDRMADHGATISEYPLTLDAIQRAADRDLTTVMGAPNLLRGGSLWDNLSVVDAIDAGCVDVLCADYHPPSLLAAPFVDTGEPLPTRVNRVTRNPAEVVGLSDRGRIAVGARADLVVVEPEPTPTVELVVVDGTEVLNVGLGGRGAEGSEPTAGPNPSLAAYPSPSAFDSSR